MASKTHPSGSATRDERLIPRLWTHVVAVYLVYHIAAILVGSVPGLYGTASRSAWKDPTVQEEFAAWANRLGSLGFDVQLQGLEEAAWRFAKSYRKLKQSAMTPFNTYQRYTGTIQSWSMFVAPHRHPSRLCIDIREPDGQWRNIYLARSNTADWRCEQFDHMRFRCAIFRYAWPQYQGAYEQFVAWLARQAAADFPEAGEIRVRYFRFKTLSPKEIRAGKSPIGSYGQAVTILLDDYR